MTAFDRATRTALFFLRQLAVMYVLMAGMVVAGLLGRFDGVIAQPAWAGGLLVVSGFLIVGGVRDAPRLTKGRHRSNWRVNILGGSSAGLGALLAFAVVKGTASSESVVGLVMPTVFGCIALAMITLETVRPREGALA